MLTLRLSQYPEGPSKFRVEAALDGNGSPGRSFVSTFRFGLTAQDREDLRWYLEDYPQYPFDPAPTIAAQIEQRMQEWGKELFNKVLCSPESIGTWDDLRPKLGDMRVEIVTTVQGAAALPWELLRDPVTDAAVALRARSFVRVHPLPAQRPRLPTGSPGPLRILLAICRPGRGEDVPFRSVASRVIEALAARPGMFELDVLRPPTFGQLSRACLAASATGKPYHIVHFDGHGAYFDTEEVAGVMDPVPRFGSLLLGRARHGAHGYIWFENPDLDENAEPIDGSTLGKLLVGAHVPVLILNACRSAHSELSHAPVPVETDPHDQVRAFGSLAQEVMDSGVAGVVAMRYNVYVATAAQYVTDLYAALVQGRSLGEAATLGRKQLAAQPYREVAYRRMPLQDWIVPTVYEGAPLAFVPPAGQGIAPSVRTDCGVDTAPATHVMAGALPPPPEWGFVGGDEILLTLDRAFDAQHVVLISGYAGSGKTAAAAEFGRWYAMTGGTGGVLFTSFEKHRSLVSVLNEFWRAFRHILTSTPPEYRALPENERRQRVLGVLNEVPVLWIWDSVEQIAGFPRGTISRWTVSERTKLLGFLTEASRTKAKFLLTSRRHERFWLGDLPAQVPVHPMPMIDRLLMLRALAEKHPEAIVHSRNWLPLLTLVKGNPLFLAALIRQALHNGLQTAEDLESFAARVRLGDPVFEDERNKGRARSLGASLAYGFEDAFTRQEREQMALLQHFQGFVNAGTLRLMGFPEEDWRLPEVEGLTPEAAISLLNRAAEIGLLVRHGSGRYSIHPALPWFLRKTVRSHYAAAPTSVAVAGGQPSPATRAFVEAIGLSGEFHRDEFYAGNKDTLETLILELPNLLHVWQLALKHDWWRALIGCMQALFVIYEHYGRRDAWGRLVSEALPVFVDPKTDGPRLGREEAWEIVTGYRVLISTDEGRWAQAERLGLLVVERQRREASAALLERPETLTDEQRDGIHSLAVGLQHFADIQSGQHKTECITTYEESIRLCQRIGEKTQEGISVYGLAIAYVVAPGVRDLQKASDLLEGSLQLFGQRDVLSRAKSYYELGCVAYERFKEARASGTRGDEARRHLNAALASCQSALSVVPPHAMTVLAKIYNLLGNTYDDAGDPESALRHYGESLRLKEAMGDVYGAALGRYNIAVNLSRTGRFHAAREYAYAALRGFETVGDRAAEMIQSARNLIRQAEQSSDR